MLSSFATTGNVNFSGTYGKKKYTVSEENAKLIKQILYENSIKGEAYIEMD